MSQNDGTIGERIATLRKAKGLGQKQVAIAVGVGVQTVSRWENNVEAPWHSNLRALARLFGVEVEHFTGDTILKIGKASGKSKKAVNAELFTEMPSAYFDHLASATELWTSGLNLRRILEKHESSLKRILNRSRGKIKVLLLDKAHKRYGSIQENGVDGDPEEYAQSIDDATSQLEKISQGRKGSLEIRYANFPLQAGLDLINPEEKKWIAYIRLYQIRKCRMQEMHEDALGRKFGIYEDQPIMRLRAGYPGHRDLFIYYKKQFITVWKEEGLSSPTHVGVDRFD